MPQFAQGVFIVPLISISAREQAPGASVLAALAECDG
jgi:hypothetical protein